MKTTRILIIVTALIIHGLFLVSWASHLKVIEWWPLQFGPVEDTAVLKKIEFSETKPIKPTLFKQESSSNDRRRFNAKIQFVPKRKHSTWIDDMFAEPDRLSPGYDFFQIYRAGTAVRNSTSIYKSQALPFDSSLARHLDNSVPFHHPFRYFPVMAYVAGLPLTLLTPWNAYFLWVFLVEVTFWMAVVVTWKRFSGAAAFWGALMWFGYMPYYLDLYLGQTSFITGFCLFLTIHGISSQQHRNPVGSFTVGSMIKPVPLYLAPVMVLNRRWSMFIVPVCLLGITSSVYFIQFPNDIGLFFNWAVGARPVPSINLPGMLLYMIPAAAIRAMILVIWGITLVATIRYRTARLEMCCLWITAYFLTYFHVWEHHFAMLLPVMILLWIHYRSKWVLFAYTLLALPNPYWLFDVSEGVLNRVLVRVPKTAACIILFVWLIIQLESHRRDQKV